MFRFGIAFFLIALLCFPVHARALTALLDPGHGGFEAGIIYTVPGSSAINEKDIDLMIAKACIQSLGAKGITAPLTRDSDRFMAILSRLSYAQTRKPAIFISIHMSGDQSFRIYSSAGTRDSDPVYFYSSMMKQGAHSGESKKFAEAMEAALKEAFPDKNVSYMPVPLPILNGLALPAIMVEVPAPANFNYGSPQLREQVALAIADGVWRYLHPVVIPNIDPLTGMINGPR